MALVGIRKDNSYMDDALRKIDEIMLTRLTTEEDILSDIFTYLLYIGGKRIRPQLCILLASLFGMQKPSQTLINACAGIELIHMATLLHDDIIDKSHMRRSCESVLSKYGMEATLLAGDFFLVKAFGICVELDQFIIKNTESACISLVRGELLEGKLSNAPWPSIQDYVEIVGKKTAPLFELAALIGAHTVGVSELIMNLVRAFGYKIGVIFQMVDDILDAFATEKILGKIPGSDLKQKTPTLVNIIWLENNEEAAIHFFSKKEPSKEDCKDALNCIRNSSVFDMSLRIALNWVEDAKKDLHNICELASVNSITSNSDTIVDSAKKDLLQLLTCIIDRVYIELKE